MDIPENNVVNNFSDNNNDEKQDKCIQEKDAVNKGEKLKRKNVLNNNDDVIPEKRKRDNEREKSSRIKMDNININVNKHNEMVMPIGEHEAAQNKKNFQLNKMKNRKLDNAYPMMSLNVKRLKTYGISSKKMKKKLLRHNKEF